MRVGDHEFCEFVAHRSHALVRTAYLLAGDVGYAEDLVQIALLKTYLARHRIIDPTALEAYARRVLVNSVISWRRRRWIAERPTALLPDIAQTDSAHAVTEAESLRRLLMRLPAKQRAAVVLRYYADLTEVQVAETLGVSRGTVSRYLTRALAALRAHMEVVV